MDSAALLDILGNENRRRILRLLAEKPCYVTEISGYLGVSPKAVIDHLEILEEAGIVQSSVNDDRRKYFKIDRNLRLEVKVSPYGFGTKSAYPASRSLDITTFRHISVDVSVDDPADPARRARELKQLRELENEISMVQRWVQGRITETLEDLTESLNGDINGDGRLYSELLLAMAEGDQTVTELAEELEAPPGVIEEALMSLERRGVVTRVDEGWELTG